MAACGTDSDRPASIAQATAEETRYSLARPMNAAQLKFSGSITTSRDSPPYLMLDSQSQRARNAAMRLMSPDTCSNSKSLRLKVRLKRQHSRKQFTFTLIAPQRHR